MGVVNMKDFPPIGKRISKGSGMIPSRMETRKMTVVEFKALLLPPFQRQLKINHKVQAVAERLKVNSHVLDGVVTLGELDGEIYLVDGQHRREGFLLSGLPECWLDVRICEFDTMEEMADEFRRLNTALNALRPDDILRACEYKIPALVEIRKKCPFIGYNFVNFNNDRSPIISMASALKGWHGSLGDMPTMRGGTSNEAVAKNLTDKDVEHFIKFFSTAYSAWGRDKTNARLWGRINITTCLWVYRQVVMPQIDSAQRRDRLTNSQFEKGLMALSADSRYVDWLEGRQTERDRLPCYTRIREIFAKRLNEELGKRLKFPNANWGA